MKEKKSSLKLIDSTEIKRNQKAWVKPSYTELNIASGTTSNDSIGGNDGGGLYTSKS